MKQRIQSHNELEVYQRAFQLAEDIFAASRTFPKEERFSLTDQVRRSSRSVCANLAEAWRKRRYRGTFISKLSDVEAEAAETQCWIAFALSHSYLKPDQAVELTSGYEGVIGTIVGMIHNVDSWLLPSPR